MSSHYQKAYFLLSVADVKQLPPDQGIEIAIVGRSNAGKSSVLNQLTQNQKLARVSKSPGRTQQINIFVLDEKRRIADLPGYGFAKAPLAAKQKWQQTINWYLGHRESLKGLVMVMDSRHPLKELDLQLLSYCEFFKLPVHIVLNKTDKLSKHATRATLESVQTRLKTYQTPISVQTFSALKGNGIDDLRARLDHWYGL